MATKKSAPKKKRPSFSAPKMPEVVDKEAVVENSDELDINETVSVIKDAPKAPVAPRTITKKGTDTVNTAIPAPPEDMIPDRVEDEEPEEEPEEDLEDTDDSEDDEELIEEMEEAEEDLEAVLQDIEAEALQEDERAEPTSAGRSSGMGIASFIMLGSLFLFGLLGWALYLNERGVLDNLSLPTSKTTIEESAETPEPTQAPVPTEEVSEQLERSEISLEILNGSGVSGAAGRQVDIFEALGYEGVEAGNAAATEGNELYVHPDFVNKIDVLLGDVEDELEIATISGELDEDSELTAQIILGS